MEDVAHSTIVAVSDDRTVTQSTFNTLIFIVSINTPPSF